MIEYISSTFTSVGLRVAVDPISKIGNIKKKSLYYGTIVDWHHAHSALIRFVVVFKPIIERYILKTVLDLCISVM